MAIRIRIPVLTQARFMDIIVVLFALKIQYKLNRPEISSEPGHLRDSGILHPRDSKAIYWVRGCFCPILGRGSGG